MTHDISITPGKTGLIILSGGMDSTTLLYEHQAEIGLALSFDYGSKHNASELPCAREHCERLGIPHLVLPLQFIDEYFQSSLLRSGGSIPTGHYAVENVKSTIVPFRNGIMLSVAAGLAESYGLSDLYIANHFGDHALYPDCQESFVRPMGEAISAGTSNGVRLLAPYTTINKGDIARIGLRLGIDYSRTWSCYQGGSVQCGLCATCRERREALAEAGIEDTTPYTHD